VPPAVVANALDQGKWGWQIQLAIVETGKRRVDCEGESVFANIADPGAVVSRSRPWRGCRTGDYRHAPPVVGSP